MKRMEILDKSFLILSTLCDYYNATPHLTGKQKRIMLNELKDIADDIQELQNILTASKEQQDGHE